MSHEAAVTTVVEQKVLPPAPEIHVPAPTAEQVQAANNAFTHSRDSDTVVGLVGLWTGILLLKDLAVENFAVPQDEEEQKRPSAPTDPSE
jgi:uncharacterized BrkB/YihY/UPF0761 family membrane protein